MNKPRQIDYFTTEEVRIIDQNVEEELEALLRISDALKQGYKLNADDLKVLGFRPKAKPSQEAVRARLRELLDNPVDFSS